MESPKDVKDIAILERCPLHVERLES